MKMKVNMDWDHRIGCYKYKNVPL